MSLPTEQIGSIPRTQALISAYRAFQDGEISQGALDAAVLTAVKDTIAALEDTSSPVVSDGEQAKFHNFCTYCVQGMSTLAPDGFTIHFASGHTRQLPRLTAGPFRYMTRARSFVEVARRYARVPVKQAVIAPSALSLLYPATPLPGYSRDEFIADLLGECTADIRGCLQAGAHRVQIDFTEGRLAVKLDPSGFLLNSFIDLNNLALDQLSDEERRLVGVHTCPGSDLDSTHSADVDYAALLPSLFELQAGSFYIALKYERDPRHVLSLIRQHRKPEQRIFIGVTDPIAPRVESPEEIRDLVLLAAEYVPLDRLGTTDDCGFAPFSDDTTTDRQTAFAKIRARVRGTALAQEALGV